MSETHEATSHLFRIGDGVGVFGRWFRLLIGVNTVLYLSINPILLNPMPAGQTGPYFGKVTLWLAVIATAYMAGMWLFGRLVFAGFSPWVGTAIFLGIPTVLTLLGLLPMPFRIAFGFYVGTSLVATFFMRYGGCEVVAFPSLVLRERYTMYCPYNAIDAVERAVTLDEFSRGHRAAAIVSLAIALLIGGYYVVEGISQVFGRYGLAFRLDDRAAWLLFIPAAHLVFMTVSSYLRERSLRSAPVRKFGVGAAVLSAVTASLVLPGVEPRHIWLATMSLGTAFVVGVLLRRWVQRRRLPLRERGVTAGARG